MLVVEVLVFQAELPCTLLYHPLSFSSPSFLLFPLLLFIHPLIYAFIPLFTYSNTFTRIHPSILQTGGEGKRTCFENLLSFLHFVYVILFNLMLLFIDI